MMVMLSSHRGCWAGWLAATYPGKIGALHSPEDWKEPVPFLPYALDNGAFTGFDEQAFLRLIGAARKAAFKPLWIAVPDVVGDRDATIKLWHLWAPRLRQYGWPLAMVMQDGMTPDDFRGDIAFIGGTTKWKWRNLSMWRDVPAFHVGRVNTERHLWQALDCGSVSCDGTGWFRGSRARFDGLIRFLERTKNGMKRDDNLTLFSSAGSAGT